MKQNAMINPMDLQQQKILSDPVKEGIKKGATWGTIFGLGFTLNPPALCATLLSHCTANTRIPAPLFIFMTTTLLTSCCTLAGGLLGGSVRFFGDPYQYRENRMKQISKKEKKQLSL